MTMYFNPATNEYMTLSNNNKTATSITLPGTGRFGTVRTNAPIRLVDFQYFTINLSGSFLYGRAAVGICNADAARVPVSGITGSDIKNKSIKISDIGTIRYYNNTSGLMIDEPTTFGNFTSGVRLGIGIDRVNKVLDIFKNEELVHSFNLLKSDISLNSGIFIYIQRLHYYNDPTTTFYLNSDASAPNHLKYNHKYLIKSNDKIYTLKNTKLEECLGITNPIPRDFIYSGFSEFSNISLVNTLTSPILLSAKYSTEELLAYYTNPTQSTYQVTMNGYDSGLILLDSTKKDLSVDIPLNYFNMGDNIVNLRYAVPGKNFKLFTYTITKEDRDTFIIKRPLDRDTSHLDPLSISVTSGTDAKIENTNVSISIPNDILKTITNSDLNIIDAIVPNTGTTPIVKGTGYEQSISLTGNINNINLIRG